MRKNVSLFILFILSLSLLSIAVSDRPVFAQQSNSVQFDVLGFDNSTIRWSLRVTIPIRPTVISPEFMQVQAGNSLLLPNFNQLDQESNTTTFVMALSTPFSEVGTNFPFETRILHLYFGVNTTLNSLYSIVPITLPTQNYVGGITISPLENWADSIKQGVFSDLHRYSNIYYVFLYISRTSDTASFMYNAMVQFPLILWIVVDTLFLVFALQVGLIVRKWRMLNVGCPRLLNGSYFGIVVALLFFLPAYMLSLRPLLAPVTFTQGDVNLFNLMAYLGALLFLSLPASYLPNSNAPRIFSGMQRTLKSKLRRSKVILDNDWLLMALELMTFTSAGLWQCRICGSQIREYLPRQLYYNIKEHWQEQHEFEWEIQEYLRKNTP